MRNSKKPEKHGQADEKGAAPHGGGTSSLLQRLLQKIAGPGEPGAGEGRPRPLPPAGRRSGSGAESLGPYLDEKRNTQPGPLE